MFNEFTKLPQVRISQLEQLISSKPKKLGYSCRTLTQPSDSALVSGLKPFYTHYRNENRICCDHLKCDCRFSLRNHEVGLKHQYLTRRKYDDYESIVRYKTEAFEKDDEVERRPFATTQRKFHHFRQNTQGNFTMAHRPEIEQKLHDRMRKQLSRKMFQEFGKSSEKEEVKVLALEYVQKYIKNKEPFKNIETLFKKVQRILSQNAQKSLRKFHLQTKSSNPNQNSKKMKKIPISSHKFTKQKSKGKKKSAKKRDTEDSVQVNTVPIDQETMDLINLLLYKDRKELVEEFLEVMVRAGLEKFQINIEKIQKILEQYSNQSHVMKTMREVMEQLGERLENSQQQQKLKSIKITAVQKILRFKIPSQSSSQLQPPQRPKRMPRKTIKTKKSQKTLRLINLQLPQSLQPNPNPDPDLDSKTPNRAKSTVSLAQQLSDEQNQNMSNCQKQSSMRLMTHQSYRSYRSGRSGKSGKDGVGVGVMEGDLVMGELKNGEKQYQDLSDKFTQQYLKSKKKTIRKSQTDPTPAPPTPQPKKPLESSFKPPPAPPNPHPNPKHSLTIKQLLFQNHQKIRKGRFYLREYELNNLIIIQSDSVLTKKKKIRFIREKINQVGVLNRKKIVEELLEYINLYQLECELILGGELGWGRGTAKRDKKGNGVALGEDLGKVCVVKRSMLDQELKFIKLSNDYFYGQQQDEQLNFKFNKRYQINQIKQKIPQSKLPQKPPKSPQKTHKNSNNALIQTSLPQIGYLLTTQPIPALTNPNPNPSPNPNQNNNLSCRQDEKKKNWRKRLEEIWDKMEERKDCRGKDGRWWGKDRGKERERENGDGSQRMGKVGKLERFLFTQNTTCL